MGDDNFQFVEMIGVFMNKKLVRIFNNINTNFKCK